MTLPLLSGATLGHPPAGVALPAYDPALVTSGIVHFGLGNFNRAHLARYTHNLMNLQRDAVSWGITGIGLLSANQARIAGLQAQDGLYTLVERDGVAERATIIGSLAEVILAAESTKAALAVIDRPITRIVSVTVTREHGYRRNRADKRLDLDHPAIGHDRAEPLRDQLVQGANVDLLSLAIPAWLRRALGTDDAGEPMEVRRPMAPLLRERALASEGDPRPMLAIEPLFGGLGSNPLIVDRVSSFFE